MYKYAKVEGYKNLGEMGLMSHIYQMVELDKETPMILLTNAYVEKQKVFKGYLFVGNGTFESILLNDYEKAEIEKNIGKFEEVDFMEFIKDTDLDGRYSGFRAINGIKT